MPIDQSKVELYAAMNMLFTAKCLVLAQQHLEAAINATPTGAQRDKLTHVNITMMLMIKDVGDYAKAEERKQAL
jgi:HAMP domain-containing protein